MRAEADPVEAVREYTALLTKLLPVNASGVCVFDVVVLGIGSDGHTASLFPGEPTVNVRDAWVASVPATGGREGRMTLTAPVIEFAKQVVSLAQGREKTPALERVWAVNGSLSETPARLVRHAMGYVTWVVDREAAGL